MKNVVNVSYSSLPYVSDCYPLGCKYSAKREEGKKAKLPTPMFTRIDRNNSGKSSSRLTITVYEEKYY
ncbi:hypothetical protein [Parabacteroides pacaensis]|uniref:hypothetical protein n=1 Tax=Parabacteroides pacaensis TaxID=2086575 RepID=UPI000D0EEEA4|nr:hypothetical protein [Parabacteroides pacaensis]